MQATNDIVVAAEQLLAAVDAARAAQAAGEPERPFGLRSMAVAAGLPDKPLYTLAEVAKATGIARSTLDDERRAGRLRAFLPPGKQRGLLVRCEWFDEWFESGSSKVRAGGKR